MVLFIKLVEAEARAVIELLQLFGMASGLRCNLGKSSASPICCTNLDLQPILATLACPLKEFPIQYLGLPLSPFRLTRNQLQPMVDKLARKTPKWKAGMLQKSGRLVLLDSALVSAAIYPMMALDLPPWFFKQADKIFRRFF